MPFPTFKTADEIPEAFRSEYEEKDGAWQPKAAASLGDNGQEALRKEREAKKAAETRAKAAEDALADLKRTAEAKDKGITEEQLQKIRDEVQKPLEQKIAEKDAALRKLTLTDRVQEKLLKAGVMPERVAKAMKDLDPGPNGRVDLTEDGNGILVRDAKGNVTAETIDDFAAKTYKVEAPFFYASTGGSGGGSAGSEGGGEGAGRYDPVAEGKALAEQQKQQAEAGKLAFR